MLWSNYFHLLLYFISASMLGSRVVNYPHGRGVEGSNIREKFNTIGSKKHMTQTPFLIGVLTKNINNIYLFKNSQPQI